MISVVVAVDVSSGASFVSAEAVDEALAEAGLDSATTDDIVAGYEAAQLQALRAGLLVAAFNALAALLATRDLPAAKLARKDADEPAADAESA